MQNVGLRPIAPPETGCSALFRPADLTFLLHAAADRMAVDLDRAAVEMGLTDVRDWLVLAALDDDQQRTQLELSRMVCVDKTTLISVLDRLEQLELVVRTVDPSDRRVRIPRITPAGRRTFAKFATARDSAEARAGWHRPRAASAAVRSAGPHRRSRVRTAACDLIQAQAAILRFVARRVRSAEIAIHRRPLSGPQLTTNSARRPQPPRQPHRPGPVWPARRR
jgi:DNA-binding MarR family transcriptional regulator